MININGKLFDTAQSAIHLQNRGLNYGDALFETMRFIDGRLIFGQDHVNRLLNSMQILHMENNPGFCIEFLENEIVRMVPDSENDAFRIKLLVWRRQGGKYTPETNQVEYAIVAETLSEFEFVLAENDFLMGVFDEFRMQQSALSALKTTGKLINVLAGIYAQKKQWDNCFLLNDQNRPMEAINGNIFLINGKNITTPDISEGCLRGIIRKQLLDIGAEQKEYSFQETSIEKRDLIEADEIWITNSISGIISISQFEGKRYRTKVAQVFIEKLNERARQL